jgi:hypothetical protein
MSSALKIASPIDALINGAANLSRADLLQLQDAIAGLVQATEPQIINLDEEREERRGQSPTSAPAKPTGWFEISYKKVNGKSYGPYKYLRYRHGGRKKSTYMGKVSPGGQS